MHGASLLKGTLLTETTRVQIVYEIQLHGNLAHFQLLKLFAQVARLSAAANSNEPGA